MSDVKDSGHGPGEPDWAQWASQIDALPVGSWQADTEWRRLSAQFGASPSHPRTAWYRTSLPWFTAAAIISLLGSLALALRWHMGGSPWTYTTMAGQRLEVTLADGTHATLGPESRLRVARYYLSGDRTVNLDGEGFFSVRHDEKHPFAVLTQTLRVTDIGTEFDVKAYDAHVRVGVARGVVAVRHVLLHAGDMMTVTERGIAIAHNANIGALAAWEQGGLAFQDTPLRDAIRDLARTFDIDITVTDSTLLKERITGSFQGSVVDNVLNAVTIALGAQYDRTGRKVVIHRPSSPIRQTPPAERPHSLTTVLYP